ncbi:MAG TPA: cytochrome c oxidase subunit 3 [Verrucomicrobiae bacterium]|jgi:cytochrome c oxidase subunit 3|nr:cytochrome c oxidase subunit 3 [Verrucomicrobiae bacterium]
MPKEAPIVEQQFEDMPQQYEASHLGMWTFLATEVLFFGGFFISYTVYRHFYGHEFIEGVKHTLILNGTINSCLLLTSGLTMALAVQAATENRIKVLVPLLLVTILFGLGFLTCKALEYREDIADKVVPGANFDPSLPLHTQIFFWLYWGMTGLHTVHMIVGVGLLSVVTAMAAQGKFSAQYYTPLEMVGLYWAFVDIVWIFLYPLLYLIGRHA